MAHKTSAMVEAGILSAIAIVFALINMYVPVVGMFLNFIWPLPIILCGMRQGMRWSIMTLLVSGVIIAILISPLHAFTLVAVFGLLGVVLGECMRSRLPPLRLLAVGSVAAFISLMISLLISILIMGINPLAMFFETFDKSLVDAVDFYRNQGMSEEEINIAVKSAKDMFGMVRVIMPGAFLICAPLITFANYLAAKAILNKLGERFESFPPFTSWDVPRWTLIPYGISILMITYYLSQPTSTLYLLGVNIQMICSVIYVLQGLAVAFWYIEQKGKPKWWRTILISLIFLSQFISQTVVLLGAFDLVFDFRKRRSVSPK